MTPKAFAAWMTRIGNPNRNPRIKTWNNKSHRIMGRDGIGLSIPQQSTASVSGGARSYSYSFEKTY
jgi:hypothetical protein